jgi:hypothetical protein
MNETSPSGGVVSKFVVFVEFELLDSSRIEIMDLPARQSFASILRSLPYINMVQALDPLDGLDAIH